MGIFDFFQPKKADPDGAVLTQLRKAGSNLSKPHDVEFFLYFPTQDAARQAAGQLQYAGFQVKVSQAAQGSDWLCLATKSVRPDLTTMQEIRKELSALTGSLGGEYDGWGTPIVE